LLAGGTEAFEDHLGLRDLVVRGAANPLLERTHVDTLDLGDTTAVYTPDVQVRLDVEVVAGGGLGPVLDSMTPISSRTESAP